MEEEKLLKCPKCGGHEVTLAHEQLFMANSGAHYCHSVKIHDSNAKAGCLECQWHGHRNQLIEDFKLP